MHHQKGAVQFYQQGVACGGIQTGNANMMALGLCVYLKINRYIASGQIYQDHTSASMLLNDVKCRETSQLNIQTSPTSMDNKSCCTIQIVRSCITSVVVQNPLQFLLERFKSSFFLQREQDGFVKSHLEELQQQVVFDLQVTQLHQNRVRVFLSVDGMREYLHQGHGAVLAGLHLVHAGQDTQHISLVFNGATDHFKLIREQKIRVQTILIHREKRIGSKLLGLSLSHHLGHLEPLGHQGTSLCPRNQPPLVISAPEGLLTGLLVVFFDLTGRYCFLAMVLLLALILHQHTQRELHVLFTILIECLPAWTAVFRGKMTEPLSQLAHSSFCQMSELLQLLLQIDVPVPQLGDDAFVLGLDLLMIDLLVREDVQLPQQIPVLFLEVSILLSQDLKHISREVSLSH